jgi:N-acylneuraminate cytidylyltransferase
MKSCIAIIPARKGSKRIPGKNIRPFLGRPIIAYSIETAIKSNIFDEVMVSTDSEEIAEISKKFGATIPFLRNPETSDDFTGIAEVILEVLNCYISCGKTFKYFCCIFPAAPFIKEKHLKEGFKLLIDGNYDSVFPIIKFSYPILRSLKLIDSRVEMNWPEYFQSRSQDLPPAYHDAGQFYWMRTDSLFEQKKIFAKKSGGIELNEMEIQDIDNESDWKIAEIKYKILNDGFKDISYQG